MMQRSHRFKLPGVIALIVLLVQAPAQASLCSGLQQLVPLAGNDQLASIGIGPIYTGPAIAGHEDEFPSDDTQRTSLPLDGALRCGLNALPQLGTHSYSCDFDIAEQVLKARVHTCYPSVHAERDSGGEGTNWTLKFAKKNAEINVWAIESNRVRITVRYAGSDDDDPFPM